MKFYDQWRQLTNGLVISRCCNPIFFALLTVVRVAK